MPRDLPIGNGSLLINFDHTCQIRDIYWPHVGQENHTNGQVWRIGVWVNDRFSWLDSPDWNQRRLYSKDSLITAATIENKDLGINLHFRDGVDFHLNILVRQCTVTNTTSDAVRVRLFFCQDFSISGTTVGDSAYYEPESQTIFHYKGKRWFAINLFTGWHGDYQYSMDQWAVGIKDGRQLEGAWKDAEDGHLSGNAVAQGRIDSVAAVHLTLNPKSQTTTWYVLTAGRDYDSVCCSSTAVLTKGPITFLDRTDAYWRLWVNNGPHTLDHLSGQLVTQYRRSLLILRTQIDNHGAITAANDYDIAQFNRDTYSYMWPRDGALVTAALIEAGYSEISRRFFNFCHTAITDQGYLLHKYTPDGSLASSWHGWYAEGERRLPIQEDETALVIWALWRHFSRFRDIEFIKHHYRGLIIRAAKWMCTYTDDATGLPLPSWDLWEERFGIHSWTVAATWAGLQAAANFAEAFGENDISLHFQRTAARMQQAVKQHLWDEKRYTFLRSLTYEQGSYRADITMDASLIGLWYFGMLAPDDTMITKTMKKLHDRLWVRSEVGGLARYENDYYHQVSQDLDNIPGNPWFICTLWLAQWYITTAETKKDLQKALNLIDWAAKHALDSGVMAEQVHPLSNEPLSVSPLTWSHATFVATVLNYNSKSEQLTAP